MACMQCCALPRHLLRHPSSEIIRGPQKGDDRQAANFEELRFCSDRWMQTKGRKFETYQIVLSLRFKVESLRPLWRVAGRHCLSRMGFIGATQLDYAQQLSGWRRWKVSAFVDDHSHAHRALFSRRACCCCLRLCSFNEVFF